jgi:hypothetical protein
LQRLLPATDKYGPAELRKDLLRLRDLVQETTHCGDVSDRGTRRGNSGHAVERAPGLDARESQLVSARRAVSPVSPA